MGERSSNPFGVLVRSKKNLGNRRNSTSSTESFEAVPETEYDHKPKKKKLSCSDKTTYECLDSIYKYLLENKNTLNDFTLSFIQGGYALILYNDKYKELMARNEIISTNDIDIHIEPITGITPLKYNKTIQIFFIDLCKKFENIIDRNEINNSNYYGTSNYLDITFDPIYISLKLYKEYCLKNGYTNDSLELHLKQNIANLLLPLEYVIFNCVHMFVLLLEAFNTVNYNNRVPKTLKILYRVIMIYNPDEYVYMTRRITEQTIALIDIIKNRKTFKDSDNIKTILTMFYEFYDSFIRDKDNIVSKFLIYLIKDLNINIQYGGGENCLKQCFYSNKNKLKNDEIILNNILALIFYNIIIKKANISQLELEIYNYYNIPLPIANQEPNFSKNFKSIQVAYGGFNKHKTNKHKINKLKTNKHKTNKLKTNKHKTNKLKTNKRKTN